MLIGDKRREIAEIVIYPGFSAEYKVFEDAINRWLEGSISGDAAPLMEKAAAVHDVALLMLKEPVEDVTPVSLFRGSDEQGRRARIYGKGATGNGLEGESPESPRRGKLRRAYNRITGADEQWLMYEFDCGAKALPLEGVSGSGDSGGPVLIMEGGEWTLAGLAAQNRWEGDLSEYRAGVCGQEFANSRISYYADWIESIIDSQSGKRRKRS